LAGAGTVREATMGQEGARLLLVEDDQQIGALLEDALADEGYAVRVAVTGREGLAALDEWNPALILLDLRMPDMDGWAFRAEQRALPGSAGIPVLLMTAFALSPDALEPLAPTAVVPKPFDLDVLLDSVRRCLEPA
jgi:CheY-like chemotaxis protein